MTSIVEALEELALHEYGEWTVNELLELAEDDKKKRR